MTSFQTTAIFKRTILKKKTSFITNLFYLNKKIQYIIILIVII